MASADTDQDDAPGSNPPEIMNSWRRGPFVGCIDEEQRQELQETLDAMREEGATFDEIREYVQAYLEELGVECQAEGRDPGAQGQRSYARGDKRVPRPES